MSRRRGGGLYLGPLAVEGGLELLLQALHLFPGARVDVVGTGPLEARVREHPCARLLAAADLDRRLRSAAYLVVPAPADAQASAALRAFSRGVPVIAAREGALAELVEPGRNGLLFEPGVARDLARRLAFAEAFPERMRRMGECALADYRARFVADSTWLSVHGERRRQPRAIN
ncbi:MAG TPA: glycosyltransferase [Burkholderiales bacterium]|nr:glycosyltransferase [Burkholderiales bacterium]